MHAGFKIKHAGYKLAQIFAGAAKGHHDTHMTLKPRAPILHSNLTVLQETFEIIV